MTIAGPVGVDMKAVKARKDAVVAPSRQGVERSLKTLESINGKPVAELIKNLPKRNCVAKSGHYRWQQVEVPQFELPSSPFANLLQRSRASSARLRSVVEQDIRSRLPRTAQKEALSDWE